MTQVRSRQNSVLDNDIVISGMSGRFPHSRTVDEFLNNLLNKVNMVNEDETRYKHINPQTPRGAGKLLELENFDRDFFGFTEEQVELSDVQSRFTLEEAFKAVMDAGVNPFSLRGTKTGVYFASGNSEHTTHAILSKSKNPHGFTGVAKGMWAGRISKFLGLEGPSLNVDTACSSSLYALHLAIKALLEGEIEAAIVSGTNLCLNPHMSLQFALLGVLSPDGVCRPFDAAANGYARAEGAVCIFLQRRRDVKRVYATVVSSRANCDGFKPEGITFPSNAAQENLLREVYNENSFNIDELGYIEAHATATSVGDPEECRAIDSVIGKKRKEPILIGSVKSNCGHSEPAAGLCSVVKALLTVNNGIIPPNINFKKPRETIEGIMSGRMIVVQNATKLPKPYVAVNSFGFGGANAHLLIKQHDQLKKTSEEIELPRLIVWSGRTHDAVVSFFKNLEKNPIDEDYIALSHASQAGGIPNMNYRGFTILQTNSATKNSIAVPKTVQYTKPIKRPIVWIFSGAGSVWTGLGKSLLQLPLFKQSIQKCQNTLKPSGMDIMQILSSDDASTYNNQLFSFVSTAAIQIALVDILHALGVKADFVIGHGVGELGCAYAEGCLSVEQMILAAYYRGKVEMESNKIIECMEPKLLNYLQHIFPKSQLRTGSWISSSAPKHKWFSASNKVASAEYFTNSLLHNTLFDEAVKILPRNSITIQIASHTLIRDVLFKNMPFALHVDMLKSSKISPLVQLLSALGSIYANGIELAVDKLYPEVKFPVSRGTNNIASQVLLDHTQKHFVYKFSNIDSTCGRTSFTIKLEDDYLFLRGHEIDGRVLVPATFYLECVWKSLVNMSGGKFEEQAVEFENVKFERATTLTENTTIELNVVLHNANGAFEVTEGGSLVVSGFVRAIVNQSKPNDIVSDSYTEFSPLGEKHFYKELKLRGYHYNEQFQAVDAAFVDGALGRVKWMENWVTFIDCMLQLHIVQMDLRTLLLPTKIGFMRIYPEHHKHYVEKEASVRVFYNKMHNRMVGGGVEISGLEASSVHRRRPPGDPVLEHYTFVSHFPAPKQTLEDVARCCIQLALENQPRSRLELVQFEAKLKNFDFFVQLQKAVGDLPLTTANCNIIHSTQCALKDTTNIVGVTHTLPHDKSYISNSYIIVANSNSLFANSRYTRIIKEMDPNGYLLLLDKANLSEKKQIPNLPEYECIGVFPSDELTVIMYKNAYSLIDLQNSKILRINSADNTFKWLDELKQLAESKSDIIVLAEDDKFSGVVGFVNCLTKEPDTKHVRVVYVSKENERNFKMSDPAVIKHLQLGLVVNIFKHGHWGTLRHLALKREIEIKPRTQHVYGNIRQIGDLSSLTWMDGPIAEKKQKVRVMYSSLNFKDVMQASGRLPMQEMGVPRVDQTCIFGFEYSGINIADGKRVMGMTYQGAVSSHIERLTAFQLPVPDNWTLEQAATVPVVYLTVYYAFFYTADIRKGKSILIHAGSGGIGIAAIRVAQAYGLEVYTTVSTSEKRNYLMKTFPTLKATNIGNSRDTSFEDLIMLRTNGHGVDFVLNSLSEDKLKASIRCLAKGGNFMEIGKFDMAKDNTINLGPFEKGITFHTILADNLLHADQKFVDDIKNHLSEDIKKCIIQPLPTTVFKAPDIEQAFRYLMSGKHIGKVLLQIRESENSKATLPVALTPQIYFNSELSYIVPGGLGGFGLELVDWMIIRGARKIVLSSSRGISNDYQKLRIAIWKNYKCEISICTANISTEKGCLELLKNAMKLGDVGGIFNLAVVLKDSIFSNQTKEMFEQSLAPKAYATKYLDQLSRKMCPQLHHFVVFSSVSCGRGNAGQTNYGMANSIMERIIEDRVQSGFPGKAVQWGAVGEVGLVADMAEGKIDLEIGGTLQQRISSCLEVLDELFNSPHPIVASMVVAEKRAQSSGQTPLEFVLNSMSIRDVKSVSVNATLTELGMDSLLSVEIKQTFERDYDIVLNTGDLRSLTIAQLVEMSQSFAEANPGGQQQQQQPQQTNKQDLDAMSGSLEKIRQFYGIIPINKNNESVVALNEVRAGELIIYIPGMTGCMDEAWQKIAQQIRAPFYMIQTHVINPSQIEPYVEYVIKHILELLNTRKMKKFQIVGYSMGAVITHFVIEQLEKLGYTGRALLVDGSPFYMRDINRNLLLGQEALDMDKLLISVLLNNLIPKLQLKVIFKDLRYCYRFEEWLVYAREKLIKFEHEEPDIAEMMLLSLYNKIKTMQNPETYANIGIINTELLLIKPTNKIIDDLDDAYGLLPFTKNSIKTETIQGTHYTMLSNPELIDLINKYFMQ